MTTKQDISSFSLRIALSAGFLSAVASRLSLWGSHSSGWQNFVNYTAQTNSFLPKSCAPLLAVLSTLAELSLGLLLLIGYRTSIVALCAAILTLLFSIAMAISFGIKEPLDYSAFAFSAGAFLLSSVPAGKWSIDQFLNK
ncbi:DoxX family membrane protein [Pinibacter aurantiacus]|uniref:DoxX family membrane protein n=1 Tax=Pinibacter aurantiacus TaxID=2851599 RepID=A0A9E2SFA1_9BACT|nr:DoxX family membrane protein [Pinibacter aurantiacus]MBV4360637.1 DoxX family membrane protein [Pinibacter aurantiacus]